MDQEIILSNKLEVFAIVSVTKAVFFKNLKTGSKIKMSIRVHRSTDYATYLDLENLDTGEKSSQPMGKVYNLLKCFHFNEIKE